MGKENDHTFTMGVDIGGTKVESILMDEGGKIISSNHHLTNASSGSKGVIDAINESVRDCLAKTEQRAVAIGVGVAGQVEAGTGKIIGSPNLPLQNISLGSIMENEFDLPVYITNDVRAATWGEWKLGAGSGRKDIILIFVGTGIGGGVVSGGNILEGCSNSAGELGHMTLVYRGRKCHCSNYGCLEAHAGGWAIAERAKEAVSGNPSRGEKILSLAGNKDEISSYTVSVAYNEGDKLAGEIIEETGKYLGSGLVTIVNAFNPCMVILGGGVIEGLPTLIDIAEKECRDKALPSAVGEIEFVKATLKEKAVAIGAAAMAKELINMKSNREYKE